MLRKLKNILYTLVTGSFTMLLSACYGPVVNDREVPKSDVLGGDHVIRVYDESNQPINGISVQCLDNVSSNLLVNSSTSVDGISVIPSAANGTNLGDSNCSLVLMDVDGTNKGGLFRSTNFTMDGRYIYYITMTTN